MSFDLSFYRLLSEASLVVQAVMALLLLTSILSWVAIISKALVLRSTQRAVDRFESGFWRSDTQVGPLYQALRKRPQGGGPLERIFVAGYREYARLAAHAANRPAALIEVVERAMQVAVQREVAVLERHLDGLATVASTAPFIGLFGTVWGIMNAFRGLSQVQTATLDMVAPGIAEALIATALGLVVAIPAAVAYNHFVAKLDELDRRQQDFARQIVNLMQGQLLVRGGGGGGGA